MANIIRAHPDEVDYPTAKDVHRAWDQGRCFKVDSVNGIEGLPLGHVCVTDFGVGRHMHGERVTIFIRYRALTRTTTIELN